MPDTYKQFAEWFYGVSGRHWFSCAGGAIITGCVGEQLRRRTTPSKPTSIHLATSPVYRIAAGVNAVHLI